MPDNSDIMRRLDGLEERVDDRLNDVNTQLKGLHEVIVRLAEQQKDIDHLTAELARLRLRFDEDTEKRLKVLENIHAGCQVVRIESSIKRMWKAFYGIVSLFLATAIGAFLYRK